MSASARLPVLSCAEAAAAEAAFLAGDTKLSWELMNRAARGVGDEARALLGRKPGRILILAGKGNNGADAFLAALHCARAGTEIVAVFAEGGPARAQAQRAWAVRKQGVRIGIVAAANLRQLAAHEFDLIFDGVLGHLITKSIMSVPAAVLFAHVMLPNDESDRQELQPPPRIYQSAMDSITRGTGDGLALYLNIVAILIVLTAFVALANSVVGFLPYVGGEAMTLERIAGWIFAPIAWLMGVPWHEAMTVGSLLGVKSVLNEFIAFIQLSSMPVNSLSEHSRLITIYALAGFANLASIGIQISGIGTMAPERRKDLADLAWPAFVAATLASCMTGCVVGIVAG